MRVAQIDFHTKIDVGSDNTNDTTSLETFPKIKEQLHNISKTHIDANTVLSRRFSLAGKSEKSLKACSNCKPTKMK